MQPSNSQEALAQLQQNQGSARSAADILNEQRQQLGANSAQDTVAGLRGAITNTTKLLNQVAPSVMGRTANSLVNNAQATRQIANEQQPIAQRLSGQSQDYTTALGDYDRANQNASNAANLMYGDQQNRTSYLQNLYNTLYGREQDAARMAEQKRQFDAQQAASRAQAANLSNLFNRNAAPVAAAASIPAEAPLRVNQTFTGPKGITGYETSQGSVLTDAGKEQNDKAFNDYLQAVRYKKASEGVPSWLPGNLGQSLIGIKSLFGL